MTITGASLIAGESVPGTGGGFEVMNPATDERLDGTFLQVGLAEVALAAAKAEEAFDAFRTTAPETRAVLLETIATNLEARREGIVARATAETGLSAARITGELARTTGQLRLFAQELRLGEHHGVRIDHALPDRTPAPGPDLRQRQIPLGPVAVFGASNFPLAFSVAGGDTASALAAGCPVIVKAHSSHAGTAEIAGQAITDAVIECGLPAGTFSMLFGPGASVGQALAANPAIKAVAFTGSQSAGVALMRTAAARPEPIPVYAEMSSINPVVWLPSAANTNIIGRAADFVASLTLGAGQFCTNPGLIFIPAQATAALDAVVTELNAAGGQTMLSSSIRQSYETGLENVGGLGAIMLAQGSRGTTQNAPAPVLFTTTADRFLSAPELQEEIFGAAALVVTYENADELRACLESLQGQLTATLHFENEDLETAGTLVPILERKAGRIIANSWPTGVEVNHAMVHGGPFPATSDSRATSVGTLAIARFQRPVSYQGFPETLLPLPVRDENPWDVPARIDGRLVR